MKLPAKAEIRAPVAEPHSPQRRTVLKYPCQFAIPHTGEVVAARMWTMLLASCMTVFGIGAELAIIGRVLGYDLVVAPQWVRDCSLAFTFAAAALVLGYGISAIRALADSRDGTALSSAGGSSFML